MWRNKVIIISGSRWTGKTMLTAVLIGLNPWIQFYANFRINKKNCKQFEDFGGLVEMLKNWNYWGVIIMDETQKLLNSRKAMSQVNMWVLQFVVESRKYWCDMILIAQTSGDIDKQIREQADYIIEMDSNPEGKGVSSLVTVKKKARDKLTGEIIFTPANLFSIERLEVLMGKLWVEYDTNEIVVLDYNKKRENGEKRSKTGWS